MDNCHLTMARRYTRALSSMADMWIFKRCLTTATTVYVPAPPPPPPSPSLPLFQASSTEWWGKEEKTMAVDISSIFQTSLVTPEEIRATQFPGKPLTVTSLS